MAERHGSEGSSHSEGRFLPQRGCRQTPSAGTAAEGRADERGWASGDPAQHWGTDGHSAATADLAGPHSPQTPREKPPCPLPTQRCWKRVPPSRAALRQLLQESAVTARSRLQPAPRVAEFRIKQHSYCKNELQQKLLHLSRRKGYIPLLFWYQMAQGLFFNKCCLLYLLTQSPLSYKPNLFP